MRSHEEGNLLAQLLNRMPQVGKVVWIGVRPGRREAVQAISTVHARIGAGLEGDRYRGRADSKRQVTLIQAEHLAAVGSMLGEEAINPARTRRNIVVQGINLLALKDKRFRVGDAIFEYTGLCHPCSRMEEELGPGGYNAMRGHGGITVKVVQEGVVQVGDEVKVMNEE